MWPLQSALGPQRYPSFESTSAATALAANYNLGLRQFSTDLTTSPVVHRPGQQPASSYQAANPYGYTGTPLPYHLPSLPTGPTFPFTLPGAGAAAQPQIGSHLWGTQPFQFEANPSVPTLDSGSGDQKVIAPTVAIAAPSGAALVATGGSIGGQPVVAGYPCAAPDKTPGVAARGVNPGETPVNGAGSVAGSTTQPSRSASPTLTPTSRAAWREKLCAQAFQFVDALQTGHIDFNQNKIGLTMVFQQLLDVPIPNDEWHIKAWQNFVSQRFREDFIEYGTFREVAVQWDNHHQQKRQDRETAVNGQTLPVPPPSNSFAAQPPKSTASASSESGSDSDPSSSSVQELSTTGKSEMDSSSRALAQDDQSCYVTQACGGPPSPQTASGGCGAPVIDTDVVQQGSPTVEKHGHPKNAEEKFAFRSSAVELTSEVLFPTYEGPLAIFDDYDFFGDVGSGSFGKVMVVRHKQTKQLRACKVVAVTTALQQELIDTEITVLKSLDHPNIMKMHEVYYGRSREDDKVANGNIYVVTQLCEGGDLFSRILHHYEKQKKPMTESHVAFMMEQILAATRYCHQRDIVHRDLKPENILFVNRTASSTLKIIDFGLANFTMKIKDQAREVKKPRTGALGKFARMLPTVNGKHIIPWNERKKVMQKAGTPHYMAPEMIEGYYDVKVDMFSIGIILCQLLTGWHPFYAPGDDEQAVRAKISAAEPVEFPAETWKCVSSDAKDLAERLLNKCSKTRLSADEATMHKWIKDPSKPSPFGNTSGLSVSIFEGLREYQAYNKFKRAVLQLLAREMSEFQIQELRKKFMALDTQGDGMLSPEELIDGMRHVGYTMGQVELQQIMDALDTQGQKFGDTSETRTQRIGYKEFVSALIERRVTFDRQQLRECFWKFDTSRSGRITFEDVKSKLTEGISFSESEWLEVTAGCVASHGEPGERPQELTFDEFVALMEHHGDS